MTPSGWHHHLRSVQGTYTPGVRPPDQRLASALFSVRFKTHQRRGPLIANRMPGGRSKKKNGGGSQGATAVGFCYLSELF